MSNPLQSYEVVEASEIGYRDWLQLQSMQAESLASVLPDRTEEEIDTLLSTNDPDTYIASHINPNKAVGTRFQANQSYRRPLVAVARDGNNMVTGWMYAANNVSGSVLERAYKMLAVPKKNYFWLREVAVRPEYRRQGVAKGLGRILLNHAISNEQPVTAYIWPDETPFLRSVLDRYGFVSTGSQSRTVFGEGSRPVIQHRMAALTVESVLAKL